MKKKVAFLSVLLVAALLLGMVPFGAFRTEAYAATTTQTANDPDVSGSKKIDKDKDTKALDPDHRDVDITLSLPSAEYQNEIDIVFVMDNSSSTQDGVPFSNYAQNLFKDILAVNPQLDINVGVIKFRGYATDMLGTGLTKYESGSTEIIDAISNTTVPGNGSNVHSGLMMADEMLTNHTSVPDDHKYVVLLTDGKSYIWNNEKGEPTTYYTQAYDSNKYKLYSNGLPVLNQKAGAYNKGAYALDVLDPAGNSNIFKFDSYADLFASNDKELTGDTGFEEFARYAYDRNAIPAGTANRHVTTSGAAIFSKFTGAPRKLPKGTDYEYYFEYVPAEGWENIKYYEPNPYVVIINEDGSYNFDENQINPNYYQYHVDCQQKGTYIAGHKWADMLEKYNCAAVTYWTSGSGGGLEMAYSFNNWLISESKYGAKIEDENSIKEMFTGISNDILYMVASGIVTDPIPEQFELKATDGTCPFTLETEADGALEPVQIDDNSWGFSLLEESADGTTASTYKYVVAYVDNSIEWTINVPVENANKVALTYTLTIKEDTPAYNEKTGELIEYPTNGDTILNYVSTDGSRGEYEFNVPSVTYAEKHLIRYHSNYPGVAEEAQLFVDDNPTKLPYDIKTSDWAKFSTDGKWTDPDGKEWEFDYWETIDGERYDVPGQYPKAEGEAVPGDDQNPDEVTPAEGQDNTQTPNNPTTNDPTTGEVVPANGGSSRMTLVAIASSSAEDGAEEEAEPELELYAQWKTASPSGGGGTPTGTTRYTVTYQYTGDVPSGAPSVPASKTYAVGASVPAASVPSMEGYTFSGWSGEVSTMPNHDVTVTGSWTADEPIDDPDTPLAPPTDGDTEIDDPDTPLAPGTVDEETEINDEETPLTPFTGDARHTGVWAGISLAALLGIILLGKKRKVNE